MLSENSGSATFRAELEYGFNTCINLGKVELYRMEANILKFIWYYPGGDIGAYGEVSCDSCQIGTPIFSSGDADFDAGKATGIQQCVDDPTSCGITVSGAHAIYAPNSGEVRIPFIDVPDAFGGINIYEIYLLQQPSTFTFDLDMNRIRPQ